MWCTKCGYGSEVCKMRLGFCPNCGGKDMTGKRPFPDSPKMVGSGKPTGKTSRKRKRRPDEA